MQIVNIMEETANCYIWWPVVLVLIVFVCLALSMDRLRNNNRGDALISIIVFISMFLGLVALMFTMQNTLHNPVQKPTGKVKYSVKLNDITPEKLSESVGEIKYENECWTYWIEENP